MIPCPRWRDGAMARRPAIINEVWQLSVSRLPWAILVCQYLSTAIVFDEQCKSVDENIKFRLKISDFDQLSFEIFALENFAKCTNLVRFTGYYQ
jgi:hypothetical protein